MPRRAPPSRSLPSRARAASLLRALPVALLLLAIAACSSGPPRVYAPLRYDYLLPIRLNVASITVENRFVPSSPGDLNSLDPAPLVPTLAAMAQDRLQAVGASGRAVFVIKDATLTRTADGIRGSLDAELDVYAGGGTRAGFAEARVIRTRTGDLGDMQQTLYDMTKQLMDAMNIEFEYQVKRSLHDWLAAAPGVPGAVEQQALPPPGGIQSAPPATSPPTTAAPQPLPYPPPGNYPPTTSYLPANPYAAPGDAASGYAAPGSARAPTPYPYAKPDSAPPAPVPYPTTNPYAAPNPYALPSTGYGAPPTQLLPPRSP